MSRKLAIWGASGHALVAADIVRLRGEYELVGFIDDGNLGQAERRFCGLPVVGRDDFQKQIQRGEVSHVLIAIGNCQARLRLSDWSRERGLSLASAVHPSATVARDVSLGAGAVVVAGAVINSGAVIGDNVIVNTCASVDHECVLDSGIHVCPGAHLAASVTVGRAAWIGIGASVIGGVRIGAGSVVGAGAVVVRDLPDGVLAYGVPARVIKRL